MHDAHGPSLSLDQQLRGRAQPQVLHTLLPLPSAVLHTGALSDDPLLRQQLCLDS